MLQVGYPSSRCKGRGTTPHPPFSSPCPIPPTTPTRSLPVLWQAQEIALPCLLRVPSSLLLPAALSASCADTLLLPRCVLLWIGVQQPTPLPPPPSLQQSRAIPQLPRLLAIHLDQRFLHSHLGKVGLLKKLRLRSLIPRCLGCISLTFCLRFFLSVKKSLGRWVFNWLVPGCLDPVEESKIGNWLATFYSSTSPLEEIIDVFLQHKLNVKSFVTTVELHLERKARMLRQPACLPPAKRCKIVEEIRITEEDMQDDPKYDLGSPVQQEVWSPSSPETDCRYSPIPSEEDQLKSVLANRDVEKESVNSLPNDEESRNPTTQPNLSMTFSSVLSSSCPSKENEFDGEIVPSCFHEDFSMANISCHGTTLGSPCTDDTDSAALNNEVRDPWSKLTVTHCHSQTQSMNATKQVSSNDSPESTQSRKDQGKDKNLNVSDFSMKHPEGMSFDSIFGTGTEDTEAIWNSKEANENDENSANDNGQDSSVVTNGEQSSKRPRNRDVDNVTWRRRIAQLMVFKQKHGHVMVSQSQKSPFFDGSLGSWVSSQRALLHKGELPEHRKRCLDLLGFCWDARKRNGQPRAKRISKMNQNREELKKQDPPEPYYEGCKVEVRLKDGKWYKGTVSNLRRMKKFVINMDDGAEVYKKLPSAGVHVLKEHDGQHTGADEDSSHALANENQTEEPLDEDDFGDENYDENDEFSDLEDCDSPNSTSTHDSLSNGSSALNDDYTSFDSLARLDENCASPGTDDEHDIWNVNHKLGVQDRCEDVIEEQALPSWNVETSKWMDIDSSILHPVHVDEMFPAQNLELDTKLKLLESFDI
eukprot:465943-Hanusia_phi.AAC.1